MRQAEKSPAPKKITPLLYARVRANHKYIMRLHEFEQDALYNHLQKQGLTEKQINEIIPPSMGRAARDLATGARAAVAGAARSVARAARRFAGGRDDNQQPRPDSVRVMSSWISNLTLVNDDSGDVVMALLNGRRYRVRRVGQNTYDAWVASASKGKFWHTNIKLKHIVRRLK